MGSRTTRARKARGLKNGLSLASITFFVSLIIAGPTQSSMGDVSVVTAIVILLVVIVISVLADMLAVAATAAEETPFHAMASDRISGAKQAVTIVRRSARVNSLFADVVGDVCGTISGALGAALALDVARMFPGVPTTITGVITISLIASATVGAKASAKGVSVRHAKNIVHMAGKLIALWQRVTGRTAA